MSFDGDSDLDDVGEKASSKGVSQEKLVGVPDGDYVFTVVKAQLLKYGEKLKYEFEIMVTHGEKDHKTKLDYWLNNKDGKGYDMARIDRLKTDLNTLGCDVDNWTKQNMRPFSQELAKVGPALTGVKFTGKVKRTGKDDKTYVNVYVNKRAEDDKPKTIGEAEIEKGAEDAGDKDIPF